MPMKVRSQKDRLRRRPCRPSTSGSFLRKISMNSPSPTVGAERLPAMWIGRSCQPLGSDAREFQGEGAASARMQGLARGLAQNCPAKTVGHDQPEVIRQQGLRKIRRHGEIEEIAEGKVIWPFA